MPPTSSDHASRSRAVAAGSSSVSPGSKPVRSTSCPNVVHDEPAADAANASARTSTTASRAGRSGTAGTLGAEQADHRRDELVLELGQAVAAPGAALLGHELRRRHDEQARDERVERRELGLLQARPRAEALEHLAEARVGAVALLDRARPGRRQ